MLISEISSQNITNGKLVRHTQHIIYILCPILYVTALCACVHVKSSGMPESSCQFILTFNLLYFVMSLDYCNLRSMQMSSFRVNNLRVCRSSHWASSFCHKHTCASQHPQTSTLMATHPARPSSTGSHQLSTVLPEFQTARTLCLNSGQSVTLRQVKKVLDLKGQQARTLQLGGVVLQDSAHGIHDDLPSSYTLGVTLKSPEAPHLGAE